MNPRLLVIDVLPEPVVGLHRRGHLRLEVVDIDVVDVWQDEAVVVLVVAGESLGGRLQALEVTKWKTLDIYL